MKILLTVSIWLTSMVAFCQWEPLDIPKTTRYDDVFFVDETNGWAVGGGARTILKTVDGGQSWELKFVAPASPDFHYLRSIEFLTPLIGFAGSLSGGLYKTVDAGENWTDITSEIPSVPGICGMSAPSESVIYACGKWSGSSPAFVLKSVDAGLNWTKTDLSSYATQLVDIFFLDEDEGFATGKANPTTDGGIVLHTTDGGANWSVVHKTMSNNDYIWKIQTPDSLNFYGSIQSDPSTENVRFIKSTNSGLNWSTLPVTNDKWNYIQMIGFKDELNGWTGGTANGSSGETVLFKTTDGGETWTKIPYGSAGTFNRFFMINSETIFMTGKQVYKYNPEYIPTGTNTDIGPHDIVCYPNPGKGPLTIEVNITSSTHWTLDVIDINGKVVNTLQDGYKQIGNYSYSIDLHQKGLYFAVLHTNEGLNYAKILIQ